MSPQNIDYIAVDIAKATLRVQTATTAFDTTNDSKGFQELLERISHFCNPMVVMEASGGYERPLMNLLFGKEIPLVLVNPGRVRAFASSNGIKAKTDPIDGKVLLEFSQQKKPRETPPPPEYRQILTELMDRRSQLSEILAREKNRLEKSPKYIIASIRKMIRFLEKEIESIDKKIEKVIASHAELQRQSQIMQSVCGIGKITAWTILTYLHEITFLNRNQVTALVGIAPFNRDSGKASGKRRICAGRAKVRKCLYMAAQSAAVHNPVIKQYVDGLRSRGKPYKCAMVAAMRKLLIHIHSQLRNPQISLAS